MSNLSERLADLLNDSGLNIKTLAQNLGINATCITHYLQGKRMPTVKSLIKIADYFNCSTDYLLGLESENPNLTFKQCPPFSEQIDAIKKHFNCKDSSFYKDTDISKSRYLDWKSGKRQPTLDNVIKIADIFECRLDFVLGRE